MFSKNSKIIKPLILLFILLSCCSIIFNYKIQNANSLTLFQEYILKKNPEYSVSIEKNLILIKGHNNQKIIKSLVQMNVKIELILEKNGLIYILCLPEGLTPKFIKLNENLLINNNSTTTSCVVTYD